MLVMVYNIMGRENALRRSAIFCLRLLSHRRTFDARDGDASDRLVCFHSWWVPHVKALFIGKRRWYTR